MFIRLLITFLLLASTAHAAPTVTGAAQTGNTLLITGSNFGVKAAAAPAYFNKFDNVETGTMPSDQITNHKNFATVETNASHSGTKSLEFDYCADSKAIVWQPNARYFQDYHVLYNSVSYRVKNDITTSSATPPADPINYELHTIPTPHCSNGGIVEHWRRNAIDLGVGADKIYFSAWVYLDKGSSTADRWQWKAFNVTSSPQLYYDIPAQYQVNTTSQQTNYWWNDVGTWYNSHAYLYYWNGTAVAHGEPSPPGPIAAPPDALVWGKWQRLEFYAQRSSASGVADGIWREQRIGKSNYSVNITAAKNWITGNDPWRYVALSHGVASVYTGYLDLKIYMDDVYVDTSQARVELCDTPTWSARTHCEIQPALTWKDGEVVVNVNQGTLTVGKDAYIYVADPNGQVNSEGYTYKSRTVPPIPKNVIGRGAM